GPAGSGRVRHRAAAGPCDGPGGRRPARRSRLPRARGPGGGPAAVRGGGRPDRVRRQWGRGGWGGGGRRRAERPAGERGGAVRWGRVDTIPACILTGVAVLPAGSWR